jgi:hypothetical protein
MPKVLLIGKDERIQDLKGLKDYLTKLIAYSDKEGVKELVKRIETKELQEFLISWKKTSIADEIKKAGDTKSALKILFKSMIDRDFPDGLIEENGCANLIGEDKGIDEILLMGGRVELKAGNYIIKGDGFLLVDKDIEIIGDGRGRSNIRLDKDLEITNKARIKISRCTIRSDEGNERVIKIIGGEVEFEDINFVGVGVKIDGGCKGIFRDNLFEKIEKLDAAIDIMNGNVNENVEKDKNRFMKVKVDISYPSILKQIKRNVEWIYVGDNEKVNSRIVLDGNIKGLIGKEGNVIKFSNNGCLVIKADNIVLRNFNIDSSGASYVIVINSREALVENCKIKGGIIFENANALIKSCEIYGSKIKAKGGAILIKKSKVEINQCKIYNNIYNGVQIIKDSDVDLKNTEIYSNGVKKSNYPQIWIENSTCKINETKIYRGIGCDGVYCSLSKIELWYSYIYNNDQRGVEYFNCKSNHKSNKIFANKNSGINIDGNNSDISIIDDEIYKNKKFGIELKNKNCKLNLINNCKIVDNAKEDISYPKGYEPFYPGTDGI